MSTPLKIDTTFRERRRIIRLLDFLKRDNLTGDQMERIGRRLQKSGKRALSPLVRKLWREKDATAIYRYTCMLDFFDNAAWLEQLINITLKRKDIAEDGKLALLDVLHESGVDVTLPPFAAMTGYGAATLDGFVAECLADGERGLVRFIDSFLDLQEDSRERMIRSAACVGSMEAVALLQILCFFENTSIVNEAVKALGRVQSGFARSVLQRVAQDAVGDVEASAKRSLRRLSFLGVRENLDLPAMFRAALPLREAQVGPVDFYGNRSLWFSWNLSEEERAGMLLLISDTEGMINASSYRMRDEKEYGHLLKEVASGSQLFPVDLEYAISILQDSLYCSREKGTYLPPDFYVDMRLFRPDFLKPKAYVPRFNISHLEGIIEKIPAYVATSNELLGEIGLEGWIISEPALYDSAEKLLALEADNSSDTVALEALETEIVRFCAEDIFPRRGDIIKRLLLAADFMFQVGSSDTVVQQTVATALSLVGGLLPEGRHPFIRQLVFDSIDTARQALAQGYDPRLEEDFDDDYDE